MKNENKYIVGIKTVILTVTLIIAVLLPNLAFKNPIKTYASNSSNTVNTKLGTVMMSTSSSKIKKGDIVPIEIYVGGENIKAFVVDLEYDMDLFDEIYIPQDIESIDKWDIFHDGFSDTGYPILSLTTRDSKYACTNEKIATIYLRAIEDIEKDTYFTLRDIFIVNNKYDDTEEGKDEYPDLTLTIKGYLNNPDIPDPDNPDPDNPDPDNPEPDNPNPEEKQYNIEYNSNTTEEVKNIPKNGIKTEGRNYNIYGIEPSRPGYTFEGWNTTLDGTGTTYLAGSIYNKDENLTLYAQWKQVQKLQNLYLSSETYKIGNIDIIKYEEGDKYISRVKKETMLIDYINNLTTNGDKIQVIKQDGTQLLDEEYVGTGMKLIVTKGEEKIELKIAVMGDLSGEGKVTAQDYSEINRALLGTNALENEFMIAGDIDESGELKATDFSDINKMLLGIL